MPFTFTAGRKSRYTGEAAIIADGELLDLALRAQAELTDALQNLSSAITACNAQAWLKSAAQDAAAAARFIERLRDLTPSDAANERRMLETVL